MTLVGLEGNPAGIVLGAAFTALLVFAALRGRADTGLAVAAVAGAGGLLVVRLASGGLGFVPGLGPAWVTPAAAIAGAGAGLRRSGRDHAEIPDSSRPDAWWLIALVAAGAIPLVLATQFRGGAAPQWAGRYLLVSGFLLAVLGWAALAQRPRPMAAAFAALAAAVTVAGLAWTSVRTHDVARAVAAIEARPEPVVVSGVYHLAREGGATYGDKRWLTMTPTAGPPEVVRVLDGAGIDRFASVQQAGERPLRYPGFRATGRTTEELFRGIDLHVTSWQRDP